MQNYYPSIAAHSWPVATITAQVHDAIPSLPPSPKVADLIAALTNPENMSDDALYDAAAKAGKPISRQLLATSCSIWGKKPCF